MVGGDWKRVKSEAGIEWSQYNNEKLEEAAREQHFRNYIGKFKNAMNEYINPTVKNLNESGLEESEYKNIFLEIAEEVYKNLKIKITDDDHTKIVNENLNNYKIDPNKDLQIQNQITAFFTKWDEEVKQVEEVSKKLIRLRELLCKDS